MSTYVDGFIDALGLRDVTFVVHDWGSGLGFQYAARHPDNVKALAFMEAILLPIPSYEAMGEKGASFWRMRAPGNPDREGRVTSQVHAFAT